MVKHVILWKLKEDLADKGAVKAGIKIEQGDITKLAVDAIVNAANQVMLGGGV